MVAILPYCINCSKKLDVSNMSDYHPDSMGEEERLCIDCAPKIKRKAKQPVPTNQSRPAEEIQQEEMKQEHLKRYKEIKTLLADSCHRKNWNRFREDVLDILKKHGALKPHVYIHPPTLFTDRQEYYLVPYFRMMLDDGDIVIAQGIWEVWGYDPETIVILPPKEKK